MVVRARARAQEVEGAREGAKRMQDMKDEIRTILRGAEPLLLEHKQAKERGDEPVPLGPLFRKNKDGSVHRRGEARDGKEPPVVLDLQHLLVDPDSFSAVRACRVATAMRARC